MNRLLAAQALALAACSSQAQPSPLLPPPALAPDAGFPCPLFPADNDWNRDVSGDPVDPHSADYLAHLNASSSFLHPDFGADPAYGTPYIAVDGGQPRLPMEFLYAMQSDPGPYPYPPDIPVEGGPQSTGDRHAIAVDLSACILYETFDTHYVGPGFHCGSGARWDLRSNALRPDGWGSATASGLPILPGLVRFDEAQAGAIHHAIGLYARSTAKAYVHPATFQVGNSNDLYAPPFGMRVRLSARFDLSKYTGLSRAILVAMQHHGMLLRDNGYDWFFTGSTDPRWVDSDLDQLKTVPASAFEVVQLGTLRR
jgi:hypothetical protein